MNCINVNSSDNINERKYSMGQTNLSIRMDEDLKEAFDEICDNLGITMTTAINIFAKRLVNDKAIPFDLNYNSNIRTSKKNNNKELDDIKSEWKYGTLCTQGINSYGISKIEVSTTNDIAEILGNSYVPNTEYPIYFKVENDLLCIKKPSEDDAKNVIFANMSNDIMRFNYRKIEWSKEYLKALNASGITSLGMIELRNKDDKAAIRIIAEETVTYFECFASFENLIFQTIESIMKWTNFQGYYTINDNQVIISFDKSKIELLSHNEISIGRGNISSNTLRMEVDKINGIKFKSFIKTNIANSEHLNKDISKEGIRYNIPAISLYTVEVNDDCIFITSNKYILQNVNK